MVKLILQVISNPLFIMVAVVISFIFFLIGSVASLNKPYSGPTGAAKRKKVKMPKKIKTKKPEKSTSEEGEEDEEL